MSIDSIKELVRKEIKEIENGAAKLPILQQFLSDIEAVENPEQAPLIDGEASDTDNIGDQNLPNVSSISSVSTGLSTISSCLSMASGLSSMSSVSSSLSDNAGILINPN